MCIRDRSQTTSGWALGLAIGGMFAMVVIFAILQWYDFSPILLISILMICLLAPRCEAIITSYQGHLMLMGKKWGAILRATMWRCGYVIMFAYVLSAPIGWIFILPVMLIADRASETWIWESIPKEGKKQLRKIWASQARDRILGRVSTNVATNSQVNESE